MKEYEIIKNYRNNDKLRKSFNSLAGRTFGLDFEGWYQNGYWGEKYNPYSIVIDGEVTANVSVNRTDFLLNGSRKHLLQLGTVMTEERYRNQGLIRRIMEEIDRDCGERADGIYLFSNDSVLDFYPKFGFRREDEVLHTTHVSTTREKSMEKFSMKDKKDWDRLEDIIQKSCPGSAFALTDNSELPMFYLTQSMRENVYYDKGLDVFAVAETEGERLLLYEVFAEKEVDIHKVIEAFGREIREAVLGFTPVDSTGFTAGKVQEEDTSFFIKGKGLEDFASWGVRIPLLANA